MDFPNSTSRQNLAFVVIEFELLQSSNRILQIPHEATSQGHGGLRQLDHQQIFPCWLVVTCTKVFHFVHKLRNDRPQRFFLFFSLLASCELDLFLLLGSSRFSVSVSRLGSFLLFLLQLLHSSFSQTLGFGSTSLSRTPVFHGSLDQLVRHILPVLLLDKPRNPRTGQEKEDDNHDSVGFRSIGPHDITSVLLEVGFLVVTHKVILLSGFLTGKHLVGTSNFHKAVLRILMLALVRMPLSTKSAIPLGNHLLVWVLLAKGLVVEPKNLVAIKPSTELILGVVIGSPIGVVCGIKAVTLFDGLGRLLRNSGWFFFLWRCFITSSLLFFR
mmetsp:Transcript_15005/g.24816  ORF Transcript_15005/g.24816 Transcript_15005/m.24816 type:complete len:328 (+) Transcript_15005:293-1276(+)